MHAESIMRKFRILTFIIPALALSGCGQGNGPESFPGTAATPLPPIPPGFCDAINFEILCPPAVFSSFASAVTTVIDNPDMSGLNTSDKVAQFQKFPNPTEFFGGTRFDLEESVDFAAGQAFTVKVWSSRSVPLTFKLEETTDGTLGVEGIGVHSGSGMWEELCYDFSGATLTVIAYSLIFDNGVQGFADVDPNNWTFFYDDITQVESCPGAADTMLPVDFENAAFNYGFNNFEGGVSTVLTNPDQSGINNSAQVARMQKFAATSGFTFGGTTLALDVPANVVAGSSFTMKVWSQRQVPVLLQPEPQGPGSGVEVLHTGTGWEELTFSLPALAGTVNGLTVIFDINTLGDAEANPNDWTFYYDDITLVPPGGGGGTAMGGQVPEVVISAADGSTPDLTPTFDTFGSGSSVVQNFAGDSSYANVVELTVGAGYGGGALAQLGLTGLTPGFATAYDEVVFKVKGLDDDTIIVKLEEPFPGASVPVTVDLGAPPAGVTVMDLGDGWFQVVIPIASFGDVSTFSQIVFQTLDGAYAEGDLLYLADIGFNNAGGGGTAMGGQVPEVIISAADGSTPDLMPTYDPFGSGSMVNQNFTGDTSYGNTVELSVGGGYGGGALAQLGLTGLTPGFATAYDEFLFKVKGLTADNTILAKLEEPFPGTSVAVTVDLTAPPAGVTVMDLGDGWSQVVIPVSAYGDVSTFSQIVFQTLDGAYAQGDLLYLADIGFNNPGAGNGGTGASTGELVAAGVGDFEGDVSGWLVFDSTMTGRDPGDSGQGGTITFDGPESTFSNVPGGSSARIYSAGMSQFPLLKLERLSEGVVANGASITVSFDWYNPVQTVDSTVGPIVGNNVVVVQLLTEIAGGGATAEDLIAPPTFLTAGPNWQSESFTTTLGPDASGGVSLFFQTNTGGNANAEMDLYIDNVSIVIN